MTRLLPRVTREAIVAAALVREQRRRCGGRRYGDAARIRDEASTHITGWWAGRGQGDWHGHLLHVAPSHSSYVARAYHPNQLADFKVRARPRASARCPLAARRVLANSFPAHMASPGRLLCHSVSLRLASSLVTSTCGGKVCSAQAAFMYLTATSAYCSSSPTASLTAVEEGTWPFGVCP